jgi:predicted small secreted protein
VEVTNALRPWDRSLGSKGRLRHFLNTDMREVSEICPVNTKIGDPDPMGRGKNSSATDTLVSALVTLRGAGEDVASLRKAVSETAAEIEAAALAEKPHCSKAAAAALLQVSAPTLDAWIAKGLIPVRRYPGFKRDRVPMKPLLALATEVRELRRMGRNRGLLIEALARLEAEDPEFRCEFRELYGAEGHRKFDRADFVSAAPGADFGPGD